MIGGAVHGGGGPALGAYLADAQPGSSRGLMAENIRDQIEEMTELGAASGHKTPLRHAWASPPPDAEWGEVEWDAYWTLYERAQGLEGCPYVEAIHDKPGEDDRPPHRHRVYLALTERGTLVRDGWSFAKQEAVSRIMEADTGAALVKGAHNVRAATFARELGREDVAQAMAAAGLLDGTRARATETPAQRMVRERRESAATKAGIAARVVQAWAASDGQAGFAFALAEGGLRLARGDKKSIPMVVDGQGKLHELGRLFATHAKATKEPVPDKEAMAARIDVAVLTKVADLPALVQAEPATPVTNVATPLNHDHKAASAMDGTAAPVAGQAAPVIVDGLATSEVATAVSKDEAVAPSRDATARGENMATRPTGSSGGAASAATAASDTSGGGGVSLADVGDGPGEPPGPGATIKQKQDYREKVAAYEERKGQAWAAYVKSLDARSKPSTTATAATTPGGQSDADIRKQAETAAEAIRRLLDDFARAYQRATSSAEIRCAVARFEAESAAIRERAGQHGDDRATGGGGPEAGGHDIGDARVGGSGGGLPGRHGDSQGWRGTEPNRGAVDSRGDHRGEPGQVGGQSRPALERHAAQARLERALEQHPEAMARLRLATQALQPDPFADLKGRAHFEAVSSAREALYARHSEERTASRDERKEHWKTIVAEQRAAADALAGAVKNEGRHARHDARAQAWAAVKEQRTATVETLKAQPKPATFDQWLEAQARIDPTARAVAAAMAEQRDRKAAAAARMDADRAHIAAVLSTHPHPDPADRDPEARAARYAGRLSDGYRERKEAMEAAQAEAMSALQGRSTGTRLLAALGIVTPEQRRADVAVALALALTDDAEARQPTPDDYKTARADGAAHAYAAQADTVAWARRPDVAQAMEKARLNAAIDAAAASGDPAVTRAIRQGDPDAARRVIQEREEAERRQQEEMERRQGMQRGSGRPRPGEGGAAAPSVGSPGTRGPR